MTDYICTSICHFRIGASVLYSNTCRGLLANGFEGHSDPGHRRHVPWTFARPSRRPLVSWARHIGARGPKLTLDGHALEITDGRLLFLTILWAIQAVLRNPTTAFEQSVWFSLPPTDRCKKKNNVRYRKRLRNNSSWSWFRFDREDGDVKIRTTLNLYEFSNLPKMLQQVQQNNASSKITVPRRATHQRQTRKEAAR